MTFALDCDDIETSQNQGRSNSFLKKIGKLLLKPLQVIINKSMTEDEFPEAMKLADVVPLHRSKSRDGHKLSSYLPITHTV